MYRIQRIWKLLAVATAIMFFLCPIQSKILAAEPIIGYSIQLELNGQAVGFFADVSGIGSENEVVEHTVVDQNGQQVTQKLPGRLKYLDVTLSRGITSDLQLWQWRQEVVDGNIQAARKDFVIRLFDATLTPIAEWNFLNGWPSKIEGKVGSTVIEEITIVHEGMNRSL